MLRQVNVHLQRNSFGLLPDHNKNELKHRAWACGPALESLEWRDLEFEASTCCIARSCLNHNKINQKWIIDVNGGVNTIKLQWPSREPVILPCE